MNRSVYKIAALTMLANCFLPIASWCNDTLSISIDTLAVATDSLSVITEPLTEIEPTFFQKLMTDAGFPFVALLLVLMIAMYRLFSRLADSLRFILDTDKTLSKAEHFDTAEKLSTYSATRNALKILTPVFLLFYLLYIAVYGTYMEGYVMEWFNLMIRWAHVVAGVMWIGASFYFVFLENNLNRTKNIREELAGNLWAVHGGGFYFLEKYKVAPKQIPEDLHWFKYEAYFTFITGFSLLVVVYYMNAKAYLIDPSIADISVLKAILIGIGSIVIGWLVYDVLCKSPLIENQLIFGLVGFVLMTFAAYVLVQFFNPRAAFIHVGAMIGAMMVGNVFFNIIPAQKAMVRAATIGEPLDASLGKKAGQRSLHNNYFTLPVIYIMISNHFPMTFGHEYNWVVLAVISLASAGIKHYWNLAEQGQVRNKILLFSVAALLTLAYVISPAFEAKMDLAIPVSFQEANEVIQKRCITCHSASPTDDAWQSAPNGVMYDTPEQIKFMSDKIMARAVRSKSMPQGNKTNMTDEERLILKRWIMQGAKID